MRIQTFIGLAFLLFAAGSCKTSYYTETDFRTVHKFDVHAHIHTANNIMAEQAAADLFEVLTVNVAIADSSLREQEKFAIQQVSTHPKQIQYITAFSMKNWDSANWTNQTIQQLRESFANGALGIKIWKNIGMVEKDSAGNMIMIDNPRFDSVIQFVIDQHKTVLGHLGEPKNCWLPVEKMTVNNDKEYFRNHPEYHMFLHPELPSYQDQIDARDRFLAKHPDMRFVGAHLGSLEYDVDSLAKRLDRFPNMAVDMAARICHLQYQSKSNLEKVRNFMIKYQDRLLYGTDLIIVETKSPEESKSRIHQRWIADWKYFATDNQMKTEEVDGEFEGLKLPKEVVDKIYYANAVKWFGIKKQ